MSAIGPDDHMRDHWWWRPGWHAGRRMYTWHITFDGQFSLHELVRVYQAALAPLSGLDFIPVRWLHLTTQGIAFTDEISRQEIADIVEAARKRLITQHPVSLTVGPAVADPEAIMLELPSANVLHPVRDSLRAAIADVRGAAKVPEAEQWSPHISIAYSNSDGIAGPYIEALQTVTRLPADITVSAVHLIELSRDTRLYQWTTTAEIPLAGLAR
jgi:2'-5' RNA ligase superfamily protein